MNAQPAGGSDLVNTQAQLPPGVDAPSPKLVREQIAHGEKMPADWERDLAPLAKRAGGWRELREIVDRLAVTRKQS